MRRGAIPLASRIHQQSQTVGIFLGVPQGRGIVVNNTARL